MSKIRELNDAFRKGERPELGRIVMTSGVRALIEESGNPLAPVVIYAKVQEFKDFTEDNDPHEEHDFGSFEYRNVKLYFKIDYYDEKYEYGSEDPADEHRTRRLLTILRADEY